MAWRPRDEALHYPALYLGIYEYLREYPDVRFLTKAIEYLQVLNQFPDAPMQRHRIAWTAAWIHATRALQAG